MNEQESIMADQGTGLICKEPKLEDLEILEKSCSMYILRYLRRHPEANQSEIMSTEGKKLSTKNRRLVDLSFWGLVDIDRDHGREVRFQLTPEGLYVAELLDLIAEMFDKRKEGMNEDMTVWMCKEMREYLAEKEKQISKSKD